MPRVGCLVGLICFGWFDLLWLVWLFGELVALWLFVHVASWRLAWFLRVFALFRVLGQPPAKKCSMHYILTIQQVPFF